jgi:hypothetical protein
MTDKWRANWTNNCKQKSQKNPRDRLTNSVRNACLLRPSNAVNAASSTRARYATTLVKRNKAATINNDWNNVFFWLEICYLKQKHDRKEMNWFDCHRLRLFCNCFCVSGATNAAKCFVTNQTPFCTAGPTKKLSLKRSFCEAVFTCFFNRVL